MENVHKTIKIWKYFIEFSKDHLNYNYLYKAGLTTTFDSEYRLPKQLVRFWRSCWKTKRIYNLVIYNLLFKTDLPYIGESVFLYFVTDNLKVGCY